MDDKDYMHLAIGKAKEGIVEGATPFGACIVKDNEVISCEHNIVWSSTDITAHAEIKAIRVACQVLNTIKLAGCIMYSTCEPCPMCFTACHWARIEKIMYGAGIADAQQAGFNELKISCEAMKKLGESEVVLQKDFLKDECVVLFQEWKKAGGRAY